ncbi:Fe-S-containing protein [Campylobacter concisus]|uniref:Fe-S-containing protein n=1 Tax=Campylobacter concisus TaxID=199 RepID=UPI00122C233E|nr:Fe-S-containing protein [Campylobacter concisus]
MSIYFYQVFLALLGFTLFAALNNNGKSLKTIFLPSFLGVVAGVLIFKAARHALVDDQFKIFIDSVTLIFLLISVLWIFFELKIAKIVTFFILGIGFGFGYSSSSVLFPLFGGELLDTLSVISFFLMIFAMILLVFLFFFISNLKSSISPLIAKILALITLVFLLIDRSSQTALELLRAGALKISSELNSQILSVSAKGIYVSEFGTYFYILVILLLCIIALCFMPKSIDKSTFGSIKYRFTKAIRENISDNAKFAFCSILIALGFSLYYDLYASRPPQISEPVLVEPVGDKFIFDVDMLKDNELHRFAYITDEGKQIRFFLLNRFSDRVSPVIVFDSCMICGDMGYIKRGNDLICISCNVRIFLPSVGKEGGCNPIPMPFIFDGKNIIVDYKTITDGANFFSKVVEKMVLDPVSRKKVSNLESRSYLYYGRTYFFENNETQAKFEANPEKYVETNGTLK